MDQSDRDDFNAALSRFSYSSNDFEIDESITVKRISTNIEKSYYLGDNSHWVVDFENDLSSRVFNTDNDSNTQRFVSDVKFSCPKCGNFNNQEVEVPEPNFAIAEKDADLTSEGEVELYCSGCEKYFEADVLIGPYSCDITLKDYEDTRVSCDPPAYEEYWEISGNPSKTFRLSAHELREIIDANAFEYGGSTINRMIFTHIFTILEAYLCDNLIKGLRDNPALLVSFSKKVDEISEKISVSDILRDPNCAKKMIEQFLKNQIYHRFDNGKKAVPFLYRAAFGFSLSSDLKDIQRLRDFVKERHDCVHRNGEEKDGKKHEHFNKVYLLEALMTAERVVEQINCNMNALII